jgi:carboxypeptidase family protein
MLAYGAFADAPTGSVEGTVTIEEIPLPGCTVTISDGTHRWETTTDGNGNYRIEKVPQGDYEVMFALSGVGERKLPLTVQGAVTKASGQLEMAVTERIMIACGLPCAAREPDNQWESPSCNDYTWNTSLIEAAEQGDRSAIELLQRRYPTTVSWEERTRIFGALLGRIANDAAIWKELETHADNYLRFSAPGDRVRAELEAYCTAHGYEVLDYLSVSLSSLQVAASDRRARPLLVRALASDDDMLLTLAIEGLARQHDESALPLIEDALRRHQLPDQPALSLSSYKSAKADALAMAYITDEGGRETYWTLREQER